jgi:hypothetical protein
MPDQKQDDPVNQKTDGENNQLVNRRAPTVVKMGALIGMTAGWMIGLCYVGVAFASASFGQQSTVDGILMGSPLLGAALGAGFGWLLRDSERFARLTLPSWTTRKEFKWGWKAGTVTGLGLGQSYIATHSPLGFYTGSVAAVFELFVPLCAALGGGIGWIFMNKVDDVVPPAPPQ